MASAVTIIQSNITKQVQPVEQKQDQEEDMCDNMCPICCNSYSMHPMGCDEVVDLTVDNEGRYQTSLNCCSHGEASVLTV